MAVYHQTQIDLSPGRSSPEYLASDSSPKILPPTPPERRAKTSKRALLQHFPARESQDDEDLANQAPQWMYTEGLMSKGPGRSPAASESSANTSLRVHPSNTPNSSGNKGYSSASSTPSYQSNFSSSGSSAKVSNSQLPSLDPWDFNCSTPNSQFSSGGSSCSPSETSGIYKMLAEIKTSMKTANEQFVEKLTNLEKTVQEMDCPPAPKRRKVLQPSREVRDVVRKVYKGLTESDENLGWDAGKPLNHPSNEAIVQKLVLEAKQQLPGTSPIIKEAVKTYFNSVSGTERLKSSGKYEAKCVLQRRRNRLMRKLQARKVALQKTAAVSEEDKRKWEDGMIPELMSSEESDNEGGFKVHPLPWHNEKLNRLFLSLDHKIDKKKSKRSKVMTLQRVEGLPSDPEPGPAFQAGQ